MSKKEENYFEQGQKDCRILYTSQAYSSLSLKQMTAERAMVIFWPPVEEQLVQMVMPLPKPRQKWLAGFKKEQPIIMAEQKINCKTCEQLLPKEEK